MSQANSFHRHIPPVDRLLGGIVGQSLINTAGHSLVVAAYRQAADELRENLQEHTHKKLEEPEQWLNERASGLIELWQTPSLRTVYNLTGTVLHTNLGRAPLPAESIAAMIKIAGSASNLEFNIETGRRGNRDNHVQQRLCELTGAEAATVVNNNAAAVMLTLNTVANRRSVAVSRGELVEIGGSFRIPDIMKRSGSKLLEVGTTNRTHASDYSAALADGAAALMRVHASNFSMQGFTASVPDKTLASLAHEKGKVFINDLGSGALIDLTRFGVPDEPTAAMAISDGADIVTFSGDKLLGGPQCGLIVGTRQWIDRINKNPMKRALRCDKVTLAALEALLALYLNPDQVIQRVPGLRLLTRSEEQIEATAKKLHEPLSSVLSGKATVNLTPCNSQVGSGAQPSRFLPSCALAITPTASSGTALKKLAGAFRQLPTPVIGRLNEGALWLDMRCLENPADFIDNLQSLSY